MSLSSSSESTVPLPTQRFKGSVNIATNGGMAGTGCISFDGRGLSGAEQAKMLETLLSKQRARKDPVSATTIPNVAIDGGMAGKGAVHIDTTHMTNEERVKAFEAALEYQANSKSEESKSCYAEGSNSMAGDGAIRIGISRGLTARQK